MADTKNQPKDKGRRRFILGVVGAAAGVISGVYGGYQLLFKNRNSEPQTIQSPQIQVEDLLKQFKTLPEDKQKNLLGKLEEVAKGTELGRTAQDLCAIVKSEGVKTIKVDSSQDGFVWYHPFHKQIQHGNFPNDYAIRAYLSGSSPLVQIGQQCITALHDIKGEWFYFRLLHRTFVPETYSPKFNFKVPIEEQIRIAKAYFRKPELTDDEAKVAYRNLLVKYYSTKLEREIIEGTHLTLAFYPLAEPSQLYAFFMRNPPQRENLRQVFGEGYNMKSEEFNQMFFGTWDVMALLPSVKAAEFVAEHGNSIAEYVSAVEKLKQGSRGEIDGEVKTLQERMREGLLKIKTLAELNLRSYQQRN